MAGTLDAVVSPHGYGTIAARRSAAVRNAAYDHVKSYAESGTPFDLENCSESEPLVCAYVATTFI